MRKTTLLAVLVAGTSFSTVGCLAEDEGDGHVDDEEAGDLFEDAHDEDAGGKADSATCSGVVVPDRGPFAKVVALTFDDGPNPATTPLILDTLRRHGVPATFFINGSRMTSDAAEAIAADIASDPQFILANHTWSHPKMTSQSSSSAARQIDDTTAVLEDAGETARFFRFPYGASNCTLNDAVRSRGYTVTGWHVDSADWCFSTAPVGSCPASEFQYVDSDLRNDMRGYVMRQVRKRGGGIVLFHDIHAYTAAQLDGIITQLKSEGFTFTSIDDAEVFPLLDGATTPPPPTSEASARTTAQLNLRSGPGTSYSILRVIPQGATVALLSGPTSGWYQVRYDGTTGYASATYLQPL